MLNLFRKKLAPIIQKKVLGKKKITIAVLYSWNHRPNECSFDKHALRESPCSDLGAQLRKYGAAGFELKNVIKYEEYTNYILQRVE